MTLLEVNLPQKRQGERERERNREREREREKKKKKEIHKERKKGRKKERKKERTNKRKKESEFDAKWYVNCRKEGTTGWISLIGFAHSENVHNSICLAYAKFDGLSCMAPGYRFWVALLFYSVSCTSLTKNSCNTKAVFKRFDRDSHVSSISHTRQPWKALEAHHICRSFWAASLAVPSSLKSGHIIGTLQITKETQQNS